MICTLRSKNCLILVFVNSKFNKFNNGRSDCILIFKRFIFYHSGLLSSEEEMSQFIKTNEMYGGVAILTKLVF